MLLRKYRFHLRPGFPEHMNQLSSTVCMHRITNVPVVLYVIRGLMGGMCAGVYRPLTAGIKIFFIPPQPSVCAVKMNKRREYTCLFPGLHAHAYGCIQHAHVSMPIPINPYIERFEEFKNPE